MKTETIVSALVMADRRRMYTRGIYPNAQRQYRAFRDRLIRLDERSKMKTYTLEGKIAELEAEVDIRDKALDDSQVDLEMWRD